MEPYRIIIVDDEASFTALLERRLRRQGHDVRALNSSAEALRVMAESNFDAALFDIRMPEMDGLELLKKAKEIYPYLEVVMLTGHGDIETAIEAMKGGAYDYLTKPVEPVKLEITLQKAAEKSRLVKNNISLATAQRSHVGSRPLIGESPKMQRLKEMIEKVADSESPVLILGESGTGKELVAQALHFWSARSDRPFIPLNVGALPSHLAESELFGHAKGAFTGAYAMKQGLVEIAHQGTLFLDEIGELELSLQVKLLRFLETGEFRRVGDPTARRVRVRIVAATNRDLAEMVAAGKFRKDLYYRLNVVSLHVPPLRERSEDIPLLIEHFFKLHCLYGVKELSPDAMDFLKNYGFPGNVRELTNIIERGILMSRGRIINREDLANPLEAAVRDLKMESVEKEHICQVLRLVKWDKPKAAELLGIALRTLYRKIDYYGLAPDKG